MVTTLTELDFNQLYDVNGGCTGCNVGLTILAVAAVFLPPPVGIVVAAYAIYTIWF